MRAEKLPSSAGRGGRDIKKKRRTTFDGSDGVVVVKRYVRFPDQHHPVCAVVVRFAAFLLRAATPPQLRRGVAWRPKIGLTKHDEN
jgi:hypothetical protein